MPRAARRIGCHASVAWGRVAGGRSAAPAGSIAGHAAPAHRRGPR